MSERRIWALIVVTLMIVAAWLYWAAEKENPHRQPSAADQSTASTTSIRTLDTDSNVDATGQLASC